MTIMGLMFSPAGTAFPCLQSWTCTSVPNWERGRWLPVTWLSGLKRSCRMSSRWIHKKKHYTKTANANIQYSYENCLAMFVFPPESVCAAKHGRHLRPADALGGGQSSSIAPPVLSVPTVPKLVHRVHREDPARDLWARVWLVPRYWVCKMYFVHRERVENIKWFCASERSSRADPGGCVWSWSF